MRIALPKTLIFLAALSISAPSRADFNNAVFQYARGDYPEAFMQMQALAETANHELAMYYLGVMYLKGQGTTQDYKMAAHWLRLSAEQAIPQAQFQLGNLYLEGKGVPRDYERAYAWYQTSSESGHKLSRRALEQAQEKLSDAELIEAKILAGEYLKKYKPKASKAPKQKP